MKALLFFLGILVFFSCGDQRSQAEFAPAMGVEANLSAAKVSFDAANMDEEQSQPDITIDRKLIRNGSLDFKTGDVKKTKAEIEKIVKALKAYTSSENENNYGDRIQYMQVIRVPAGQFDELVKQVEALGEKTENKNINTQDVTEEFIDVEARLKTKKELEVRYREILKQAKTIADIVSIEGQIGQVRSEIESMEGRLTYLKNQVSYSTLTVSYYESIGKEFGFFGRIKESLGNGWDNLLSFFIFLINVWPFVLIFLAVIFWWWRRRKRKAGSVMN